MNKRKDDEVEKRLRQYAEKIEKFYPSDDNDFRLGDDISWIRHNRSIIRNLGQQGAITPVFPKSALLILGKVSDKQKLTNQLYQILEFVDKLHGLGCHIGYLTDWWQRYFQVVGGANFYHDVFRRVQYTSPFRIVPSKDKWVVTQLQGRKFHKEFAILDETTTLIVETYSSSLVTRKLPSGVGA
jgi:hypothetical protein